MLVFGRHECVGGLERIHKDSKLSDHIEVA